MTTTKTIRSLPFQVREIENRWIPMSDGTRLAARIWLPEGAEEQPVPAIVEYIPYRKRDGTRLRDEPMHRYFAGHGYAALRIDLRGSGDSEGLLCDEYLEREQLDGVEALRWIAEQPWCSGRVGMMGKSWGGFNALQIAALRPPELAAILTVCSTDDRYADDAHYMGGCLLNENLIWGSVLLALNAYPPDPEIVGERWHELWLERLDATPLFPALWLEHQRRDEYWKHGSVCEDFGRIACPVYAVGGWADGYSNAVPRLLAGLTVPRQGLVGPWAHVYPHDGVPGPAIGFLQECLRWWERWLRDGASQEPIEDEEPLYRVWMQTSVPPRAFHEERPGRWVAEDSWPSARIEPRAFGFTKAELVAPEAAERAPLVSVLVCTPQITGLDAGSWCGFGFYGDAPGDQRADDGRSLVFDSAPLEETLEILGAPRVRLALSVDRPLAFLAVRLNELRPDGSSTRITYGLLNLTHRHGHEKPAPIAPGKRYEVTLELNDVAHAFARGQRLRLALSTTYWPLVWPSPEPVSLTVFPADCTLELPVRPPRAADETLRAFEPPEAAPASPVTPVGSETDAASGEGPDSRRTLERDLATGETIYTAMLDADETGWPIMERLEAIQTEQGHAVVERFRIHPDDPLSARAEILHRAILRRAGWSVRIEVNTRLSATAEHFLLEGELQAFEDGREVRARSWSQRIPRDHL